MKVTPALAGVILAGWVLGTEPVAGHHSLAAEFDVTRMITVTGTITNMRWTNPHSWLHVDVKNARGQVVNRNPGLAMIGGCTDTNEFNFLQWKAVTAWGVPYRDTQARV